MQYEDNRVGDLHLQFVWSGLSPSASLLISLAFMKATETSDPLGARPGALADLQKLAHADLCTDDSASKTEPQHLIGSAVKGSASGCAIQFKRYLSILTLHI